MSKTKTRTGREEQPFDESGTDAKERAYRLMERCAKRLNSWGVAVMVITFDKDPMTDAADVNYFAPRGMLDYAMQLERRNTGEG